MNKLSFLFFVLLIAGCTQPGGAINNSVVNNNSVVQQSNNTGLQSNVSNIVSNSFSDYVISDPISVFTAIDMSLLNVSCSGSDLEIAECIKSWQEDNMIYCNAGMFTDCNDAMRFNFMLPGIYPTGEIIREKVSNDSVYGECFSYAVTYCSIADYYNLTCRLMNSLTKPSQRPGYSGGPTTGMGPDEYNRLEVKLDANGYSYSYDLMRGIARETFEHYWPEVLINGTWMPFDGSNKATGGNVTADYYSGKNDFEVTNWSLNDPKLQTPVSDFPSGSSGFPSSVSNISSSSGNCTASDITELLSGACNAPYLTNCGSICDFIAPGQSFCTNSCNIADLSCYESCSSEQFYYVCDFFCARESDFGSCYNSCSGKVLNQACYNQCIGFM